MTHVFCILLGIQYPGLLVESNGDMWLVQFSKHTTWVNSNRCTKELK